MAIWFNRCHSWGKSTGSNFVTTGPTKIDMILRDPPGSASYTYLQKGTSWSHNETTSDAVVWNLSNKLTVHLGPNTETAVGFGVLILNDIKSVSDNTLGLTQNITNTWNNTTTYTTTTTEQWSTSSDPAYVGSTGDVFIGHSTNIAFSKTLNVGVVKDSTGKPVLSTGNSYAMTPQFGTAFLILSISYRERVVAKSS